MSRWSAHRGQVEPLAALAAVFAVCVGFGIYGVVLTESTEQEEQSIAKPTLERVDALIGTAGTVPTDDLNATAAAAAPDGYAVQITIETADNQWRGGPSPPPGADTASMPVSVEVQPGIVEPGTLRVEVWNE